MPTKVQKVASSMLHPVLAESARNAWLGSPRSRSETDRHPEARQGRSRQQQAKGKSDDHDGARSADRPHRHRFVIPGRGKALSMLRPAPMHSSAMRSMRVPGLRWRVAVRMARVARRCRSALFRARVAQPRSRGVRAGKCHAAMLEMIANEPVIDGKCHDTTCQGGHAHGEPEAGG